MMNKWIQFFKQKAYEFRWPLLAGFFVGTSYIPFPPWALLFCYTPLWIFIVRDSKSLKQAFWGGWVTQFLLTMIGFHWIAYTAHEFGSLPWIISVAALLLFCAFMHLYIAVAPVLALWARKKWNLSTVQTLFLIPLIHSLLERIWPAIFQWNLGYTLLWAKIPIYNFADIIGFEGLSSLILLANAWIAMIWLFQFEQKNKSLRQLAMLIGIFLVLCVVGTYHGAKWYETDRNIKVTVVQGNIGNQEKIEAEKGRGFQDDIINLFLKLSAQGVQVAPDTDLLLWPETAFPDYLDAPFRNRKHPQLLASGLSAIGKPLMTGAYSVERNDVDPRKSLSYNALFLVDPNVNQLDTPYRKTNLLVFGEYLPLSETFPILLTYIPWVANFGRGQGPDVLTLDHHGEPVHFGGQICYEGLYPEFSRGLSEKGADILVNVTNDSWFGQPSEPRQHLFMTFGRAIETRRPLVRSTNTGISTAILANGKVLQQSPLHKEWVGDFVIRYKKDAEKTVFVQYGHWDWLILCAAIILILLRGILNARSRRS
jgi:apolipoprotein N-acyltransferase